MARVKKGLNAHKRHKKVLKLAKGFYGQKRKVYRAAKPTLDCKNQRRCEIERHFLQQTDERSKSCRN